MGSMISMDQSIIIRENEMEGSNYKTTPGGRDKSFVLPQSEQKIDPEQTQSPILAATAPKRVDQLTPNLSTSGIATGFENKVNQKFEGIMKDLEAGQQDVG